MKKKTAVGLGALVTISTTAFVIACGTGPASTEAAGSTRQALTPTYFDVPDPSGNTTVHSGIYAKPHGDAGFPTDPAFCFFTKITGPLTGFGDFSNHGLDNFVTIRPDDTTGEWIGQVAASSSIMHMTYGCVTFGSLTNAGNAATEGLQEWDTFTQTGATGFPGVSADLPAAADRTPSFCTFNSIKGNFYRLYANCTSGSWTTVENDATATRSSDAARIRAQGMSCAEVAWSPFGGGHSSYTSVVTTGASCYTKWSGMPGAGLIQFGPVQVSSTTTGALLMNIDDGVCWIDGVSGPLASSSEEAIITTKAVGTATWWAIQSTTAGSATATCIKTSQSQ